MIQKLNKLSKVTALLVLITSCITLYIHFNYLEHCALESLKEEIMVQNLQSQNKPLPYLDGGVCIDFTDFFVYIFSLIPCILLCLWSFLFIRKHKAVEVFSTVKKANYYFLMGTLVIVSIFSLLLCIGAIKDLLGFFSLGGYK